MLTSKKALYERTPVERDLFYGICADLPGIIKEGLTYCSGDDLVKIYDSLVDYPDKQDCINILTVMINCLKGEE